MLLTSATVIGRTSTARAWEAGIGVSAERRCGPEPCPVGADQRSWPLALPGRGGDRPTRRRSSAAGGRVRAPIARRDADRRRRARLVRPHVARRRRRIRRWRRSGRSCASFGAVVDALGDVARTAAEAAARLTLPVGLATFYDTGMERVAAVAARARPALSLRGPARRLEDKLHQREALRAAGLPTPRTVALPAGADRATRGAGRRVDRAIPAVLKPRRASGSWHTFPVAGVDALGRALGRARRPRTPKSRLLEEYLPDGPPMPRRLRGRLRLGGDGRRSPGA